MSKTPVNLTPAVRIEPPLHIVHREIETYLHSIYSGHDDAVLNEMERYAAERNFPIVGRMVGPFLEVMARAVGARTVFELGSGFGYSAYWFSRAVGEGGKVTCTEGSEDNVVLGRKFLERTGRGSRVEFHLGWAQEIFKSTPGTFDVIYNDVDKDAYPEVWKLVRERIRPGGLYIADNALWGGRVALKGKVEDLVEGYTEAVKEHNALIQNDREFEFFLSPVRDGVIVARRRD